MPDFLIDSTTGDIAQVNGIPQSVSDVDLNAQRLDQLMYTIKGEWFWNKERGLPYFTEILGKVKSKGAIDSIYYSAILSESYIESVLEFNSELDTASRTYKPYFVAKTTDGTAIGVIS